MFISMSYLLPTSTILSSIQASTAVLPNYQIVCIFYGIDLSPSHHNVLERLLDEPLSIKIFGALLFRFQRCWSLLGTISL
uniref:Putative secreted protein n=1 Tax=Xenopsylla cheopis TaxID=163159 RepID=A0A6M2DVV3_XENCH